MMPTCSYKGCRKVAEEYVGKIKNGPDNMDEEPIYLCPKHAKKLRKLLGVKWNGN